jgi:hypothetical protein
MTSKLKKDWKTVSAKLDSEVDNLCELFEALFSKVDVGDAQENEKSHWTEFLSNKIAGITPKEFGLKAKEILESAESEIEQELALCDLLRIPRPFNIQIPGNQLKRQLLQLLKLSNLPPIILTRAWAFRWIYVYTDQNNPEPKEGGKKLSTIKRQVKEGTKIVGLKKLFKRAAYIEKHIGTGEPEKWADDKIEVDPVHVQAPNPKDYPTGELGG